MTAHILDPPPPVISPEQAAADREYFRRHGREQARLRKRAKEQDYRDRQQARLNELAGQWTDIREALHDMPWYDRTPVRMSLMLMLKGQGLNHREIGACLGYTQPYVTELLGRESACR